MHEIIQHTQPWWNKGLRNIYGLAEIIIRMVVLPKRLNRNHASNNPRHGNECTDTYRHIYEIKQPETWQ